MGRWVELPITALAAVVFGWRLGQPSAWWDEAVTRDVVSRPLDDMIALLGSIDLVHAGYYLGVRSLLGPDPSITAIRVLSVLAAAATAAVLVLSLIHI